MPDDVVCKRCGSLLSRGTSADCPACLLDFGVHGYETGPTATSFIRLKEFGDYELLDEIARGGMGIVCRARQKSLNRIVAVKLILAGQWAGPAHIQRFNASKRRRRQRPAWITRTSFPSMILVNMPGNTSSA